MFAHELTVNLHTALLLCCWAVDPLGRWTIALLLHWVLLVCWSIDPLVCCAIGLLGRLLPLTNSLTFWALCYSSSQLPRMVTFSNTQIWATVTVGYTFRDTMVKRYLYFFREPTNQRDSHLVWTVIMWSKLKQRKTLPIKP